MTSDYIHLDGGEVLAIQDVAKRHVAYGRLKDVAEFLARWFGVTQRAVEAIVTTTRWRNFDVWKCGVYAKRACSTTSGIRSVLIGPKDLNLCGKCQDRPVAYRTTVTGNSMGHGLCRECYERQIAARPGLPDGWRAWSRPRFMQENIAETKYGVDE